MASDQLGKFGEARKAPQATGMCENQQASGRKAPQVRGMCENQQVSRGFSSPSPNAVPNLLSLMQHYANSVTRLL